VEVDAEGETRFIGGVAIAENNVVIRYGDSTIYCDYAEYNPDTRDALVKGNVRVYRGTQFFSGDRALYNFETKLFRSADMRGDFPPFRFSADTVGSMGPKDYLVRYGVFTTSDSSKPDYTFRAKGIRIYPKDRIVFTRVTLYVGTTPVFWWPYLWQSLNEDQAFSISPGYKSSWGAFLLTTYSFPIAENITAKFHFDLYQERGFGVGLTSGFKYGKEDRSTGLLRAYYIADSNPDENNTGNKRGATGEGRYRVSVQHRAFITDDIYASIDMNLLSDEKFLEDFAEGEFSKDPQPDNVLSVTKLGQNYALSFIARGQLNEFQDTTERLPEVALDFKRQPFFGTRFFYEGESSAGYYRRAYSDNRALPDYDFIRVDSLHQFVYPTTLFGWLSFVPRVGMRGTFYSDSGRLGTETRFFTVEDVLPTGEVIRRTDSESKAAVIGGGSKFRGVLNGGFEASFKFSKEWDNVQSQTWGLDGLRHVVQPYTNLSLAWSSIDPDELLQIDRYIPSTQLPPIDFPQFTGVDSIPSWSILRLGVRNRLQTRRDNSTLNWLEMDTFFDVNIVEPEFPGGLEEGTVSNLNNSLVWNPLPWVNFRFDSQIPLLDDGFYQINTGLNFMVNRSLQLGIAHRFISDSPYFQDSNLISFGGYYRINDHWGFSFREQYELDDSVLESQRYELHRDLSSWVASAGFVIRDNRGEDEIGFLLTFTLKDIPQVSLPFNFDPQGKGGNE